MTAFKGGEDYNHASPSEAHRGDMLNEPWAWKKERSRLLLQYLLLLLVSVRRGKLPTWVWGAGVLPVDG